MSANEANKLKCPDCRYFGATCTLSRYVTAGNDFFQENSFCARFSVILILMPATTA